MDHSCKLVFFVNGKKICDNAVDPEYTLLYYLREELQLKGTKQGCGEGGCGICTVMISKMDKKTGHAKHYSTYACLTLVVSLHGCSVTTVEGIGSIRSKLHPVQERIALAHGSQCGFCTPGFVMSMYSLLRNNPKPNLKQIEENLTGNLCRCTGYRPILEGFATFSSESFRGCGKQDCCQLKGSRVVEKSCDNQVEKALFESSQFQLYDPSQDVIFPPELMVKANVYSKDDFVIRGRRASWYQPTKLEKLLQLKSDYPWAVINVGNTELGIDSKLKNKFHSVHLNPSWISEMTSVDIEKGGLVIGAAVTLTQLEEELKKCIEDLSETKTRTFVALLEMLRWFGSKQVKNVASLGGNIMNCSPVSDLNPLLFAAGASLTIRNKERSRKIVVEDSFFKGYLLNSVKSDEILLNVFIPYSSESDFIQGYKQCRRQTDDISIVNCAFRVTFNLQEKTVEELKMIFGGMDDKLKRSKKTQELAIGKKWNNELLETVTDALLSEFQLRRSAPGGMIRFRETLVVSFFFKFYNWIRNRIEDPGTLYIEECCSGRPNVSASQIYTQVTNESMDPVGKPVIHSTALQQASGEATFIDDIPKLSNELQAAPVLSTRASAFIKRIDCNKALALQGVHGFFSAKDLTEDTNKMGIVIQDEELFASKRVEYVGNVIGVVVAETRAMAREAAEMVLVEYQDEIPILTLEDAIEKKTNWEPRMVEAGDVEKGLSSSEHILEGEFRIGGQEHFYIETQSALVQPTSDGEIIVYSASQSPTDVQKNVCSVLGLPWNRVVCRTKRLGGGFGGKEIKASHIASYAAVPAYKLKRPVRLVLDRDEDMKIVGGRHPFLAKWKVGFNDHGVIEALDLDMAANAGFSLDASDAMANKAVMHADNVYRISNSRIKCSIYKTNLASNTAIRGTGAPQSMLIMEDIITRVAAFLKMDPKEVRDANMFQTSNPVTHYGQNLENCTIKRCWDQVLKQANYLERQKKVTEFNSCHDFVKRGLSAIPCKMAISFGFRTLEQAGALVHIYKDGSVLLSHGGVEMGQGLHTKMIQIASRVLEVPIEQIYISETATDKLANTAPSAASCSSDLNGMAVKEACEKVKERLDPYVKTGTGWLEAIEQALNDRVSLSATGFFATPGLLDYDYVTKKKSHPYNYFTYGAAVTEVEIDTLTGNHTVLGTDIVMDVGESLNPAIDIGQIEGAFVFGYGLYVLEEHLHSPEGKQLTIGPSIYKIPSIQDIPCKFNVSLLKDSKNPRAVYSSRGIGEPPLFLAASVFFAIKEAIRAKRNSSEPFRLDSPATSERIRMACEDHLVWKIQETASKANDSDASWSIRV